MKNKQLKVNKKNKKVKKGRGKENRITANLKAIKSVFCQIDDRLMAMETSGPFELFSEIMSLRDFVDRKIRTMESLIESYSIPKPKRAKK